MIYDNGNKSVSNDCFLMKIICYHFNRTTFLRSKMNLYTFLSLLTFCKSFKGESLVNMHGNTNLSKMKENCGWCMSYIQSFCRYHTVLEKETLNFF